MDKVSMMITARRLFKDTVDLPTIPVIVSKVVTMLEQQESTPEEITDLILSDQVLAARVLKIVNSPLYRSRIEITSVKKALLFIGFKSVREMILTSYFVDTFKDKQQPFDMKTFWTHSFSVGAISSHIARISGYSDLEKAYMLGILLDIGKVFLGHYKMDEYGRMLANIRNTSLTTHQAEHQYFGTTHCEVGLFLAQRWNFPPLYCDAISHHHSAKTIVEDPLLGSIVALADFYCLSHDAQAGFAQASIPGEAEDHAWEAYRQHAKGNIPPSLEHFLSDLDEKYALVSQDVDALFNTMTGL